MDRKQLSDKDKFYLSKLQNFLKVEKGEVSIQNRIGLLSFVLSSEDRILIDLLGNKKQKDAARKKLLRKPHCTRATNIGIVTISLH